MKDEKNIQETCLILHPYDTRKLPGKLGRIDCKGTRPKDPEK